MSTDSLPTLSMESAYAQESTLIAGVQAGEAAACEAMVRRHGPQMAAVARRFFRSEPDVDDALQDAFISAFNAIGRFESTSRLGTWLHRITVNACLMKLRSRSRRQETSIDGLLPEFGWTGHHVQAPVRFGEDAVAAAESGENQRLVREAIERLPEAYREILLLRDIEGLDTTETAALLNTSETNVKTRLHRARQALRTLLEPVFGDGE